MTCGESHAAVFLAAFSTGLLWYRRAYAVAANRGVFISLRPLLGCLQPNRPEPPPPASCFSTLRTAAKKMLGCSSTTSSTVLRAELGIYPFKTNRDVRKLKWQCKVKNGPEKSLPAIVGRAVWEKITYGRDGIRWDNVVDKIWKELGGDQEDMLSVEKFGGYKTENIAEREGLALRNTVNQEKHSRDIREVEGRYWNENALARPNGLREKAETAISCRGPGPTRKKKEI